MGDVRKMDETKAIVRGLVDDDSRVSTRRKSKTKTLLKILERARELAIGS
ncbi:hypothetical protein MUK42_36086 [Musa troglodytarum]|uniref:Uncharacterized protein n=1 Tax=Musa troglodytarum TaxID=320322 RepID=A0A9E7KCC2_9LILI|nr:hypothetical protein MUK42_36086 [Musa troglodytarum]